MSFEVMSKRCYDTAMMPRWCRHRPVTAALEFISWPYTGCPKNLRLSLMDIYVHQQKQRNHLGLTPATGALILHLRLEKFMNSLADRNNIYHITRARKNYANYTQTLHSTIHPSDLPHVTMCIVWGANPTQTLHWTIHWVVSNPTQKLYTKAYTATLHGNGTQFYLGAHLRKTRSAPKKN